MKDISEYNDNVSEQEVFSFLCERVMAGEICSFSQLKGFAAPLFRDRQRNQALIMRVFELIQRLYWGFFALISPATHKKLWGEIVIQDKDFPDAGDLKRTLQISNLYIAMLDIHGYTKFCMDSRKNLSMMHTLDWAIENEIRRIATACGAISQRERGDEVVVVAASATDAITATLSIIDYFSMTDTVADPTIPTRRSGDATALPVFKISAGITGGNTTSPLIITEKATLSGFLLNSGARLQTRANELSPSESRVMIAKQVQMNYQKENAQTKCTLASNNAVYFFDTGHIEFKGVMIPTCEVVFNAVGRYKEQFSEEMGRLFVSTRENMWEQRIFIDLMELLIKVAQSMPKFQVTLPAPVHEILTITNESIVRLSHVALNAYMEENYPSAVGILHDFIAIIGMIPTFDRLILDYLTGITEKYTLLLDSFNDGIDRQVDENAAAIFQGNYYQVWAAAKKGALMYEKLRVLGRKSSHIAKKKNLWYALIKQHQEAMAFTLYSGKK